MKLAKYLDKKGNIYLLDEPTAGLHASDVKNIMRLFGWIVKRGSTVIVIEHNLDVMKQADHIIDIGPDGGTAGGRVVFTGTPRKWQKPRIRSQPDISENLWNADQMPVYDQTFPDGNPRDKHDFPLRAGCNIKIISNMP